MPARSTQASANRGKSSKSAGGTSGIPNMAQRSKGKSSTGNRSKRELAGSVKTALSPIGTDTNHSPIPTTLDDAELEMTEGKMRKQAQQKWALRMNAIAPTGADSDEDETEGDE